MGEEEQRPSRLKKAPHLLESIQNQMENSKCWNSKQKFLSIEATRVHLRELLEGSLYSSEAQVDQLSDKKTQNFRTTKNTHETVTMQVCTISTCKQSFPS
jgi:hypothetical protein